MGSHKVNNIRGIVPVVPTPIKNGSIDLPSIENLILFLKSFDIGGMWILGTGSEDMNLSLNDRIDIAHCISDCIEFDDNAILGAGFFSSKDSTTFIRETSNLNFCAYHIMPYNNLISTYAIEKMYSQFADFSTKPIFMYTSGNWSGKLSVSSIERLSNHENIAGIKYSSRDTVDMFNVLNLKRHDFQVLTSIATQLYPCLSMGSLAHTTSLASCIPEVLIKIYELFNKKDSIAIDVQCRLNRFIEKIVCAKKHNFLSSAEEKFILKWRRVISNCDVTFPYIELTVEEQNIIQSALKDLGFYEI